MITNADIWSLLEQFYSDGFTVETLSKTTGISAELLERCRKKETLNRDDLQELTYVLAFLSELYMQDTTSINYLKDLVAMLTWYFMISKEAIANYLHLTKEEFETFLADPRNYPNCYDLSMNLMLLYVTLVRDKRL
ncbi:hypothetical protein GCM10008910_33070 [Faecalicatena orotica]|uniref:Uncharacterized protein n=1 Tax=Faecalicatena orotica TaxID=1544 RepID=A0A2Y9BJQ7_9FIRM|nr:HTH domain-containing protein [Faecalicatena orotica]PWJ23490.1 hypothetical protein A8806_114116 [Faecalicatena orotica]SSA57752.1 hypothetical protein SAMN05216536_114116 [Faecalicatena orotica]